MEPKQGGSESQGPGAPSPRKNLYPWGDSSGFRDRDGDSCQHSEWPGLGGQLEAKGRELGVGQHSGLLHSFSSFCFLLLDAFIPWSTLGQALGACPRRHLVLGAAENLTSQEVDQVCRDGGDEEKENQALQGLPERGQFLELLLRLRRQGTGAQEAKGPGKGRTVGERVGGETRPKTNGAGSPEMNTSGL